MIENVLVQIQAQDAGNGYVYNTQTMNIVHSVIQLHMVCAYVRRGSRERRRLK